MKILILKVILLLTILLPACSTKDEWQPSAKEQKALLDTLVKISKEKPHYPRSEFSYIKLWWDHPEVAILQCNVTSSSFSSPKIDSFKYSATSIFILSKDGWKFKRSFGQVYKK